MRSWFCTFGVPTTLRSDRGPQFAARDFQVFLKNWNIKWKPCSSYYASSNKHTVGNVKKMKCLVLTTLETMDRGLLELRMTPLNGMNPAEQVFGRLVRTLVPSVDSGQRRILSVLQLA